MTIYDFINTINDCWNIVFTVFDCNKEDLVVIDTDDGEKTQFEASELLWSNYVDYEIGGTDMWVDNGQIHIEFNIEVDEEEEF
jgi:hypothetical protein